MGRFSPLLLVVGAVAFACLVWLAESRRARTQFTPEPRRVSGPDTPAEYLTRAGGVQIVSFYTATGTISRGDPALVCYSVSNAVSVRITPPVADVSPSLSRCIQVTPQQTTTYRLDARGADGSTASSSFEIQVRPAAPRIDKLTISAKEISRGDPFDMCYTVTNAAALKLEPAAVQVAPADNRCYRWFPLRTTAYKLTAFGDGGRTDVLTFTVRVNNK